MIKAENIGININDKRYPFTSWISSRMKTIETRNTPTLRCYVGKRVGIVRTGKGKAVCIGYATISKEIQYNDADSFRADRYAHMVDPYMTEYAFNGVKYGYVLTDFVPCEPFSPAGRGIISRRLFN